MLQGGRGNLGLDLCDYRAMCGRVLVKNKATEYIQR